MTLGEGHLRPPIELSWRDIHRFVTESNHIEGIHDVNPNELTEFRRFINLRTITVEELERFVSVYQPEAKLRTKAGMDVRIGMYLPPRGGPGIAQDLEPLLDLANSSRADIAAFQVHVLYEKLHPFTDGNGRSGRMLWYHMMRGTELMSLGFLHAFYYQTLRNA